MLLKGKRRSDIITQPFISCVLHWMHGVNGSPALLSLFYCTMTHIVTKICHENRGRCLPIHQLRAHKGSCQGLEQPLIPAKKFAVQQEATSVVSQERRPSPSCINMVGSVVQAINGLLKAFKKSWVVSRHAALNRMPSDGESLKIRGNSPLVAAAKAFTGAKCPLENLPRQSASSGAAANTLPIYRRTSLCNAMQHKHAFVHWPFNNSAQAKCCDTFLIKVRLSRGGGMCGDESSPPDRTSY